MTNIEILFKLIDKNLITHKNHPFNEHPLYYKEFKELLHSFPCEELYSSSGKRNAILTKLQLCDSIPFNPKTYCQGISEIVLYFNALLKDLDFTPEKKLTTSGTDVDIQIRTGVATYNIEIKSPELNPPTAFSGIVIENLFRTTEKNWTKGIDKIENIKLKKNDDNKICDYLKSAQTKFNDSPNEKICNILFVALPITEIQRYFGYITNDISGLFAPNSSMPIMTPDQFSKTDVIILSSIVDGHTFSYDKIVSSWKLDEYFNFMIRNPFKSLEPMVAKELLDIIPNSTLEFDQYYDSFKKACLQEGIKSGDNNLANDLMPLVFPHYFSKYYSKFWSALL